MTRFPLKTRGNDVILLKGASGKIKKGILKTKTNYTDNERLEYKAKANEKAEPTISR
jgi:hypothetical protein